MGIWRRGEKGGEKEGNFIFQRCSHEKKFLRIVKIHRFVKECEVSR
jgi:hypothetical protein